MGCIRHHVGYLTVFIFTLLHGLEMEKAALGSPAAANAGETPSRLRHSQSGTCHNRSDDDWKRIAINDLEHIPIMHIDFFFDSVLQNVETGLVELVATSLVKRGTVRNGLMAGFPALPSKSKAAGEATAFMTLNNFFKGVVEACKKIDADFEDLVFFDYSSGSPPMSERGGDTRPNASLVLKMQSKTQESDWSDIVLPIVFKPVDNVRNLEDNALKIACSCHYLLRNDPRRHFAFGLTIEDGNTRLWFFSRSHVMVSEAFSFTTQYGCLIRIFIALTFHPTAPQALETLGYDSSMKRIVDNGEIRYGIRMGEKWYRLVKPLSDVKAESIRGRATRVWEARDEESTTASSVVIKEVWLDINAKTEGEVMRELMEKLPEDVFFQYFLRVLEDGCVLRCDAQQLNTFTLMRGKFLSVEDIRHYLCPFGVSASPVAKSSPSSHQSQLTGKRLTLSIQEYLGELSFSHLFQPRKKYRIMFEQVCTTFSDLKNVPQMFQALADITNALKALSDAGYVHCDISSGNVLWDNKTQNGRLADLEFVKDMSDQSISQDAKTGTPDFMAIEVARGRYLFLPENGDDDDEEPNSLISRQTVNDSTVPFRSNPLHDVESTWWLAVWTIFYHLPVPAHDVAPEHLTVWRMNSVIEALFNGCENVLAREDFLCRKTKFEDYTAKMPREYDALVQSISDLAYFLVRTFRFAERGPQIRQQRFTKVHSVFIDTYAELGKAAQLLNLDKVVDLPWAITMVHNAHIAQKLSTDETVALELDIPASSGNRGQSSPRISSPSRKRELLMMDM